MLTSIINGIHRQVFCIPLLFHYFFIVCCLVEGEFVVEQGQDADFVGLYLADLGFLALFVAPAVVGFLHHEVEDLENLWLCILLKSHGDILPMTVLQ